MRQYIAVIVLLSYVDQCVGVRCYQCASSAEPDGEDTCGAYSAFDSSRNVPVDCGSSDSNSPGFFCMKHVELGPIGFAWEKRWRQVIRRCAEDAEFGVSSACHSTVQLNGVYVEKCYCTPDNPDEPCNSAPILAQSPLATVAKFIIVSALVVIVNN